MRRLAEVQNENRRLRKCLEEAKLIIEYQKKTYEILGISLTRMGNEGSD